MLTKICALISIVYMFIMATETSVSLIRADRRTRCKRIESYKNGKFAAMYLAAFPLYFAAYIENGLLLAVVNAVNSTILVAVLSFDIPALIALTTEFIYTVALIFCILLIVANTMLLSVSVFFRIVANKLSLMRIKRGRRNVIVLVGFGEINKNVLASMKREKGSIKKLSKQDTDVLVLTNDITDEFKDEMYVHRAAYMQFSSDSDLGDFLAKNCGAFNKRHVRVIIKLDDESKNIKAAFEIARIADILGEEMASAYSSYKDYGIGLDAYVLSDGDSDNLYRRIVRRSHGAVHPYDSSKIIADDFIFTHPLTRSVPNLIDTERAALKANTEIRVMLVGFEELGHRLFKLLVENSQYLQEYTEADGKQSLREADIKYFIFDKNADEESGKFNHGYLHYKYWLEKNGNDPDYFELPPETADVTPVPTEPEDRNFLDSLKDRLTDAGYGFNVIIISDNDDVRNLDIAERLSAAVRERGVEEKTVIYVRLSSKALSEQAKTKYGDEIPVVPFGDTASLYTYDKIVGEGVAGMAKDRHLCYAIEDKKDDMTDEEAQRGALDKWLFRWESVQRESNVYACLALRTRFNLMGFDLARSEFKSLPDDSELFLKKYNKGNPVDTLDKKINGKKLVNYSDRKYRAPDTVRTNLAITEHMRWNAYYINNGFVPASKSEHTTIPKSELMRRRKHINITTFEGLSEYDEWRERELGVAHDDADIIKYDYQLMDDAVWILHRNGYKIIKR